MDIEVIYYIVKMEDFWEIV